MKCAFLLAVSLFALILPSGERSAHVYTFRYENVLGTSLELKVQASSAASAGRAGTAALTEIDRQAKILSAWDPQSEFSRWASTFGQPVAVSPELYEVLDLFDRWRERTGGALDASAEAVTRLWKAAERRGRPPTPDELATAARSVRQTHWQLDPSHRTATHLSRTPLALNSFAKSYIAGRSADAALGLGGVTSVVVNIGGDLLARGRITESVDIADPESGAENSPPIARLRIQDRAVATSGNYRRGVEIGGRHYSHIVDPRTALPSEEILSSTVVASNPADAGALATAFSVLTPDESLRLAASIPGAEFLLITKDHRRVTSPGWRAFETVAFQAAPTGPGPKAGQWDESFELTINVELASFGGRSRRPYLAIWVEDENKFPVRTIALWYDKDRYLPELKAWYRGDRLRSTAEKTDLAHSVSSATRSAGSYTFQWDGKDNAGRMVKPGKYTVFIEAAREHGSHELIRQEMDFNGVPVQIKLSGKKEITSASLDYHKINAR